MIEYIKMEYIGVIYKDIDKRVNKNNDNLFFIYILFLFK